MIRSIPLEAAPTARQVQAILLELEAELRALGAVVEQTEYGAIRFKIPPLWKAPHLGILHAVTSGRATVGAAAGEPWRVRYELRFTTLQWTAALLSIAVVAAGIRLGTFVIFYALVAVWLLFYVLPYTLATLRFRSIVKSLMHDVVRRVYLKGETGGA